MVQHNDRQTANVTNGKILYPKNKNINNPKMILRICGITRGVMEIFANEIYNEEIVKLQEVLRK